MEFGAEINRFRQQVEKSHADDSAGAEAQNEMQLVAQAQRQQPAQERAEARTGGND
jgi:hypothetical protein